MAYNTTYHASLKWAPREIFRRTPRNALDLKYANPICVTIQPTDISKMIDEVNQKYKRKVHNIVIAYDK